MNPILLMAAALGVQSHLDLCLSRKRHRAPYSPCKTCGNPAKGGHCFKCQEKERADLQVLRESDDADGALQIMYGDESGPLGVIEKRERPGICSGSFGASMPRFSSYSAIRDAGTLPEPPVVVVIRSEPGE